MNQETQLITVSTELPLEKLSATEQHLNELQANYMPLKINGIVDVEGFKRVYEARQHVKKLRIELTKHAKGMRDKINEHINNILAQEKSAVSRLKAIEEHLEAEEEKIEAEKQRIKAENERKANERLQQRVQLLAAVNASHDLIELKTMKDESFDRLYIEKQEANRVAQEKAAEELRIQQRNAQRAQELAKVQSEPIEGISEMSDVEFLAILAERTQAFEEREKQRLADEQQRQKVLQELKELREKTDALEKEKREREEEEERKRQQAIRHRTKRLIDSGLHLKESGDLELVYKTRFAKVPAIQIEAATDEQFENLIGALADTVADIKLQKSKDEEEAAEKLAQQKLQEEKEKQEREKKDQEEREKQRIALMSDYEKMENYIAALWLVPQPEFTTPSAIEARHIHMPRVNAVLNDMLLEIKEAQQ